MFRVQPLPPVTALDVQAELPATRERRETPTLLQPAVHVVRPASDGTATRPSVGIQPIADAGSHQGIFGRGRPGPAAPIGPPVPAPVLPGLPPVPAPAAVPVPAPPPPVAVPSMAPPGSPGSPVAQPGARVAPPANTIPRGTSADDEARVLAASIAPGSQPLPPAELMRRVGDLTGIAPVSVSTAPRGVTRAELEEQQRGGAILGFRELPGGGFETSRLRSPGQFADAVQGRIRGVDTTGLSAAARDNVLRVVDYLRSSAAADATRAQTPAQILDGLRGPTDTPANRVTSNLRMQGWQVTQLGAGDAVRARGQIAPYAEPVSFIIPPAFTPTRDGRIDLNLHTHGFPYGTMNNAVYGRFDWANITNDFRGITLVPESPGRHEQLKRLLANNGAGFQAFMDNSVRTLAGAQAMPSPAGRPETAIRSLSLTGHSGSYEFIGPLLQQRNGYLDRLRGFGLFDSTYGYNDLYAGVARRLDRNNGVFMAIGVNGHDTGTNVAAIAQLAGQRVQHLPAGRRPDLRANIIVGNQDDRGSQDYYVNTQHYGVQNEHMGDFFRALEQRLPPR